MSDRESTNNEDILQMAITAAKNGQKEGARVMFRQVYARNKRNETAMMWLAKLASNPKDRRQWLQRILEVNPENEAAKKQLDKMTYTQAASNNRILVMGGAIAFVLIVVLLAVVLIALSS